MDRRSFLAGLLGMAGATALASAVKPQSAQAGIINPGTGILDELEASEPEITEARHRPGHRNWHRHRPRRYYRRRAWRRICRRVRINGRWRRRCWRRRVWI